jgi:putative ABC transport system permease protein
VTPFRLAVLSLTRRKVSTSLALTAIALSVAFSGVLLRLYVLSGARFSTLADGPDAVVGAKAGGIEILLGALNGEGRYPGFIPFQLYISLKTRQAVRFEDGAEAAPDFIRAITPFVYFAKYRGYRVVGTDRSILRGARELAEGRWAEGLGEVVLGASVSRGEVKVGDTIGVVPWTSDQGTPGKGRQLRVTGVLAPTGKSWDAELFASVDTAWSVLGAADLRGQSIWKEKVLHYYLVDLAPEAFPRLRSLVDRRTVAQAIEVNDELARLEELTGTGRSLGLLVSILIVVLGALGVTAMMVTRFEAMGTQLAVLRAMGYEKREIRAWLLWEGALLGGGASVIGAGLDLAIFPLVRGLLGGALPRSPLVGAGILCSSPVWAMAVWGTTMAVFVPLYRLYHQDVHFALRA